MKNERNKYIKLVAQKIVKAEKELFLGKNVQENQQKIEKIMSSLSFEDVLLLDDYIQRKKLLTK